jgi:acetyl esterase
MTAIDPQTQALLDGMNAEGNPKLHELSVEDARAGILQMTLQLDIPKEEVRECQERTIPGPAGDIPVRIYWPDAEADAALPILLLYHGGGFVLGNLDTHENVSRFYCANAQVIVISVDYRLSPENKFPLGAEDCYAALCWAAENAAALGGDAKRIAVTGDSAGGNLSAVVCQQAKLRNGPEIAFQLLAYPVTSMDINAEYESRENFGQGKHFLSKLDLKWFSDMYFENPEADAKDLMASPILAEDLSGQPPALVITAGYDPLHDEGEHYAERLKEAGVPVEYVCFESTIHGFMSFAGAIDAGKEALALGAARLKENLQA